MALPGTFALLSTIPWVERLGGLRVKTVISDTGESEVSTLIIIITIIVIINF